jgi:hypothetical protein
MWEACPGVGAPDTHGLGRRDPATGQVTGIRVLDPKETGKPPVKGRFRQEARRDTGQI